MEVRQLVARNVRRLRVQQDLSQEQLAVDADVERAYVSGLERGLRNSTIVVLERVAKALGVPIAQLFVVPSAGEAAPRTLPAGRHSKAGRFARRKA